MHCFGFLFNFFILFLSFFPLIKDVGLLLKSTHNNCNIKPLKYGGSLQINANASWKRKHLTALEDFFIVLTACKLSKFNNK